MLELEQARTINEDVSLDQLCRVMSEMEYPYVIYEDMVFTPWDVCWALMRPEIREYKIPKKQDLVEKLKTGSASNCRFCH